MKVHVSGKELLIRDAMLILQVKQAEIARALNLSPGQISKLINCEQNNPNFNESFDILPSHLKAFLKSSCGQFAIQIIPSGF